MVVASQAVEDKARNLCRAIDRGLRDWQGKTTECLLWTRDGSSFLHTTRAPFPLISASIPAHTHHRRAE